MRQAAARADQSGLRALLGEDFYMLSCAGAADREILFAIDLFDGARIGGDIFNWREFINDFVARVMRFYAYHNTETYCDPDNLVIRPEFNSLDQGSLPAPLSSRSLACQSRWGITSLTCRPSAWSCSSGVSRRWTRIPWISVNPTMSRIE